MPIYAKPNSSVTKEVNNVGVFIGVMLLGPIFFLCIGMVGHFIFSLILTLIIGIPLWLSVWGGWSGSSTPSGPSASSIRNGSIKVGCGWIPEQAAPWLLPWRARHRSDWPQGDLTICWMGGVDVRWRLTNHSLKSP